MALSLRRKAQHDFLKLLRATRGLLGCLTVPERAALGTKILTVIAARAKAGIDLSKADGDPDLLAQVDKWIGEVETAFKVKREVKPRNEERDKEIVRLRDVEQKTWGQKSQVVNPTRRPTAA